MVLVMREWAVQPIRDPIYFPLATRMMRTGGLYFLHRCEERAISGLDTELIE